MDPKTLYYISGVLVVVVSLLGAFGWDSIKTRVRRAEARGVDPGDWTALLADVTKLQGQAIDAEQWRELRTDLKELKQRVPSTSWVDRMDKKTADQHALTATAQNHELRIDLLERTSREQRTQLDEIKATSIETNVLVKQLVKHLDQEHGA